MLETAVEQWFSVCERGTHSMSVSWTLSDVQIHGAPPRPPEWGIPGWTQQSVFLQAFPPGNTDAGSGSRTTSLV